MYVYFPLVIRIVIVGNACVDIVIRNIHQLECPVGIRIAIFLGIVQCCDGNGDGRLVILYG